MKGLEHTSNTGGWRARELDLTSAALACIALSMVVLALALTGRAIGLWMGLATAAVGAVTLAAARPEWRLPRKEWLAAVPLGIWYVLQAWGPEMQPDAAGYQLGLVAEWLRDGRLPSRVGFYEVLPQGMGMLYGVAMAAGGAPLARLLHLLFFLGCVGLLFRLGRHPSAGLIFFAIPVAAISGTSGYTDVAQVFFALAAVTLLLEERWCAAGLCAGFVYAIKISGLIAVAAGLLYLILRRKPGGAMRFLAGAAVVAAPWMARAVRLTGNPLAPLANQWFPNDAFHSVTDSAFSESVRASVEWWRVPWLVTFDGLALQGLLGPVFLLLPLLALAAIRSARGRLWLGAACVLALPWLLNPGARFALLPAAFVCLAAAEALPGRLLWSLAALHAMLSLPPLMDRYAHPQAWRLHGWRQQLSKQYLAPVELVNGRVKPGERMLDLVGLPYLYLRTVPVGPAASAEVDQLTDTLYQAVGSPPPEFELKAQWPLRFVRALRVRAGSPPDSIPWSVAEVAPQRDGANVPVLRNWFVQAWPVPADAALAFDGNPASRWQSWSPAKKGAFVELRFDRPVPIDGALLRLRNYQTGQDVRLYLQSPADGRWTEAPLSWRQMPPRLPRRAAAAFLRSRGIRWIVARDEPGGLGEIGQALRMAPEAWGVEPAGRADNVWLFRLNEPTR